MPVSDETWAAIEHAYTTTHESEVAIARRLGVNHLLIYTRARTRKWQRPEATQNEAPHAEAPPARPARRPPRPKPGARTKRKPPPDSQRARDELIRRLYGAIATKLTKLEERMADGQPAMTPEESERHTRELGSMVQGFEKVTEVATDAAKSDAAVRPVQPVVTTLADIERVRRELAQRLQRAWGRTNG